MRGAIIDQSPFGRLERPSSPSLSQSTNTGVEGATCVAIESASATMDPLSITASIVGIGRAVPTVVKSLEDVSDKLSRSNLTLLAICSESSSINAALGQIETIFRHHEQERLLRFQQQPALACALIVPMLEREF